MKEFIEKLIGRLEESKKVLEDAAVKEMCTNGHTLDFENYNGGIGAVKYVITLVKHLVEEHKGGWIEELLEAKKNCGEDSDCSECPFGQIEDRCILAELQIEGGNNGWIPCSERLPELFETYIVTIKMKYEWEKEWEYHVDVADYTCDDGYIDGAWNTFNDWCEGQECHVIAWQPLPEPYKGENS